MLDKEFKDVLSAAQAGGEWAWSVIYRDLSGQVYGYLRAQGAAEPDDLVGEVFLDLARNINSFQGDEGRFRSWVFTVAHHRLIDERRYRSRRPVDPTADLARHGPAGNAEEEAVDALTSDEVRRLIDGLTPDQRDVLLLRIFGDLTLPEIAAIVDKRLGAVKALQRRGLASVASRLSKNRVPL